MTTAAQQVERGISGGTGTGAGVPALLLFLGALAVLSAVARLAGMGEALSSGVLPKEAGDVPYVKHPALSALHLVPGIAFLLLGPFQFMPAIRRRWPAVHRWSGRTFILSGAVVAVTAMVINAIFPPVGGALKSAAVYLFGMAQIAALAIALRAILRRDIPRHRAWMIRAFAIGLGVSTMRFYFLPVYLISGIPSDFSLGLGMWIGFGVNVVVAEVILRRERRLSGFSRKAA
jgi:uncharacterized membrane protein